MSTSSIPTSIFTSVYRTTTIPYYNTTTITSSYYTTSSYTRTLYSTTSTALATTSSYTTTATVTPTITPKMAPAMVPDLAIPDNTINTNGSNVTLTLSWGEPFNNLDSIVNYTVSCSADVICPPNFTTTDNTTRSYTITNLTTMTTYTFSVVATNSIGSGEAGVVMITTPPGEVIVILHIHTVNVPLYIPYTCMYGTALMQCRTRTSFTHVCADQLEQSTFAILDKISRVANDTRSRWFCD